MKTFLRFGLALLLLAAHSAHAQGEYTNWYFGQNAGLRFVPGVAPQPLLDGAISTLSPCATLSDAAGNMLLYSDGEKVWNRQHQLMPGGQGLGAHDMAAQGCAVWRVPGRPTAYLLTQRLTGPSHPSSKGLPLAAEVNLSGAGSLGEVTRTSLPIVADSVLQRLGTREFMPYQALVRHANGRDSWLLLRTSGKGYLVAVLLDASGQWPRASVVASRVFAERANGEVTWGGALAAAPDGRTLVINDLTYSYLLSFDPATGVVSPPLMLAYPPSTIGQQINPYAMGAAFSPNGSRLYLSRIYQSTILSIGSSATQVVQYDLTAGTPAAVAASGIEIYNVGSQAAASLPLPHYCQRGRDGRVYFSVPGAAALDVILEPNARGSACRYTPGYQPLQGRTAMRALPMQPNDANTGLNGEVYPLTATPGPSDPGSTSASLALPNLITPNGDPLNQFFVLKGLNAPDWSIRLYSRWGREIFAQDSYDNRWDAAGHPNGLYYYLLTNAQTGQKLKGWLEVAR